MSFQSARPSIHRAKKPCMALVWNQIFHFWNTKQKSLYRSELTFSAKFTLWMTLEESRLMSWPKFAANNAATRRQLVSFHLSAQSFVLRNLGSSYNREESLGCWWLKSHCSRHRTELFLRSFPSRLHRFVAAINAENYVGCLSLLTKSRRSDWDSSFDEMSRFAAPTLSSGCWSCEKCYNKKHKSI